MSIFDYLRKKRSSSSASVAKERLQIMIAHERSARSHPDYLPQMQQEIIAVVRKYIAIDSDQVMVHLDDTDDCSILELNITLPD